MKYEIVELEEKMVVGVSIRTSNQNGKAIQDIGLAWQKLFQKGNYDQIPNKVNGKTIWLYTDYEGYYTKPYRFFAGVEVRKKSENRESAIIPKGKYAKFHIIGDVQNSVWQALQEIWGMKLKRTYRGDFEEYQNNTEDMTKQEIDIYIGVEG